ncbi:hypothetical protein BGE01nite_45910 [Brevifollis gellanilyticus]|uniref:Uncharacterized protein n=1 Tax=Brevifollis gellanilyticus TaxID=748831 RepID=A0A512MEY1_9BACT|nr:hypothetical protein BGE01nite_45910 [Brevifollis gellanilyticus]
MCVLTAYAELPGTGPIEVSDSGFLEKDHEALRLRWAQQMLLPDAEKRWKGKPWADQARVVTDAGLKLWLTRQTPNEDAMKRMTQTVEALLKAGCEEPLACLMAHKILFWPKKDWRVHERSFSHALKGVDDTQYPAALRAWIIDERIDLLKSHERNVSEPFQNEQAQMMAAAMKDASYNQEFESVLVRDFIDWLSNSNELELRNLELLKKSIEECAYSEWVKETMLADLETRWAWNIRGGKVAVMVKEDAWKGFEGHLQAAEKHAQKAWELRPDRPEAAAKMLSVVMGTSGGPVKLREWFDRAVKAQLDYVPAYSTLAYACTARWGGSDQYVLTLARRFAETKRYDTEVPRQLFYACKRIAVEQANARGVFSHPSIKDAVVEFARGTLEHAETDPAHALRERSLAAITAWLAGDDALAARALKATGGKLDHESIVELGSLLRHPDGMKISVAAGSGEWGEELKAVELAYRQYNMKKVQEMLAKIQTQSLKNDAARTYVQELTATLDMPAKLAKGGWHPLPVHAGLATCLSTGGEWSVSVPGEITLTGGDVYQADLTFLVPVGDQVEMRGEVSMAMPPEKDWFYNWVVSPMLRWQPERASFPPVASGVRGVLYHKAGEKPKMALAGKFYTKRVGEQETPIKPVNTFHLTVNGPNVDYAFNGVAMPPQRTSDLKLESPRGLVALAGIYIPMGGKVTFRKLEVRTVK